MSDLQKYIENRKKLTLSLLSLMTPDMESLRSALSYEKRDVKAD